MVVMIGTTSHLVMHKCESYDHANTVAVSKYLVNCLVLTAI